MNRAKALLILALSAGHVAAAQAATLSGVHGQVMVNAGGGYQPADETTELKRGDLILVGADSGGLLSFEDGCSAALNADSVVAVGAQSPCAAEQQTQAQSQGIPGGSGGGGSMGGASTGAGGVGGSGGVGALGGVTGMTAGAGFGIVPGVIAVGATVASVGVGVMSSVAAANKSKPASP